jgi:hypothetical protein
MQDITLAINIPHPQLEKVDNNVIRTSVVYGIREIKSELGRRLPRSGLVQRCALWKFWSASE